MGPLMEVDQGAFHLPAFMEDVPPPDHPGIQEVAPGPQDVVGQDRLDTPEVVHVAQKGIGPDLGPEGGDPDPVLGQKGTDPGLGLEGIDQDPGRGPGQGDAGPGQESIGQDPGPDLEGTDPDLDQSPGDQGPDPGNGQVQEDGRDHDQKGGQKAPDPGAGLYRKGGHMRDLARVNSHMIEANQNRGRDPSSQPNHDRDQDQYKLVLV